MTTNYLYSAQPRVVDPRPRGFTIVELLIIVVVIAILATITIVSYGGIQKRALEVSLQADLKSAATMLEVDNTHSGAYPATEGAADGGKGLKKSPTTNFQYSFTALDNSYCISATSTKTGVRSFYTSSQTGQMVEGLCTGHSPTSPTMAGSSWVVGTIATQPWVDVEYGNGTFVAIAGNVTTVPSVVARSTDGGQTWTTPSNVGTLNAGEPFLSFTGTKFVAGFAAGRGISALSPDAMTWQHNAPTPSTYSYQVKDIAYGGGIYVGVKATPPDATYSWMRSSTDGLNWTNVESGVLYSTWNSVIFADNKFVAVGAGPGARVATSTDGITWTSRSVPQANTLRSVAYGNGKFVAVSSDGTNRVMTSPDGITWTLQNAAEANAWQAVVYGGGKFVAIANSGTNRVMSSTDGVTWASHAAAQANPWTALTYGNGCFVASASSGTNRIMRSCE